MATTLNLKSSTLDTYMMHINQRKIKKIITKLLIAPGWWGGDLVIPLLSPALPC